MSPAPAFPRRSSLYGPRAPVPYSLLRLPYSAPWPILGVFDAADTAGPPGGLPLIGERFPPLIGVGRGAGDRPSSPFRHHLLRVYLLGRFDRGTHRIGLPPSRFSVYQVLRWTSFKPSKRGLPRRAK